MDFLLRHKDFVVLDGGLSTYCEELGADCSSDLWSAALLVKDPAIIKAAHRAFMQNGADILTTASYQASVMGFAKAGIDEEKARDLMKTSVKLAQEVRSEAVESSVLVAASVGCYGAALANGAEFTGNYGSCTSEELRSFHQERMEVLAGAGPDLLACETVPKLSEVELLTELLQPHGVKAWISVGCKDGQHLYSGENLSEVVRLVDEHDVNRLVQAIGVNCTDPEHVTECIQVLSSAMASASTQRHIIVYPNRGENWDADSREWIIGSGKSDAEFAALAKAWHSSGAVVIGGCCSTTPALIAAVRSSLEEDTSSSAKAKQDER